MKSFSSPHPPSTSPPIPPLALEIRQLIDLQSKDLTWVQGDPSLKAYGVRTPERAEPHCLCFVSEPHQLLLAQEKGASIIIAHKKLIPPLNPTSASTSAQSPSDPSAPTSASYPSRPPGTSGPPPFLSSEIGPGIFSTPSIPGAMATILPFFDTKSSRFWSQGHHPQSFIHPTAHLGDCVHIGPFCYVGEGVSIGDQTTLTSNVVLEKGSQVGSNCLLHAFVFLGADCTLGDHCEIHPNTTIGSDGFGFVPNPQGPPKKIPQLGKVIIEDHVEIGANCAIDRATLTETRIGRGTKLDNQTHIAHNCQIGENGLFAAGFLVAGSTTIGNHFQCGGAVACVGHIHITDQVTVAGRSVITKNIEKPGHYAGFPIEPHHDALRTMANLPHIAEMRRELGMIKKALNLESKSKIDIDKDP